MNHPQSKDLICSSQYQPILNVLPTYENQPNYNQLLHLQNRTVSLEFDLQQHSVHLPYITSTPLVDNMQYVTYSIPFYRIRIQLFVETLTPTTRCGMATDLANTNGISPVTQALRIP